VEAYGQEWEISMSGNPDGVGALMQFVPLLLIGFLMAIIPYKLAPRVGANRATWLILSLVPILNFIFFYYVAYRIAAHVLDRLNAISTRLGDAAPGRSA
jgi:hypothetical protein